MPSIKSRRAKNFTSTFSIADQRPCPAIKRGQVGGGLHYFMGGGQRPRRIHQSVGCPADSFERIGYGTIWLLTDGRFNCRGGGNAVRDLIQNLNTIK